MACNSIATTRAEIVQVALTGEQLQSLLMGLTGITDKALVSVGYYNDNAYCEFAGCQVYVEQEENTVVLRVYGDDQGRVDTVKGMIDPNFSRALIKAQQKAVIAKLAKLGKLSNVASKNTGVAMTLEVKI